MWQPNVEDLARKREVVTWDMRGHGATDAPEEAERYSHDACLGDMVALLDTVGIKHAVIGGMSLGGYLSLEFYRRVPDRVLGLILVDTGPGFRNAEAREGWNRWALDRAAQLERHGLSALPGGREQLEANHRHGAVGLAHAARGMLVQQDGDVLATLPEITVPTLIVVGSEDQPFLAAADVMHKRIPKARKIVLDGAGHAANLDAPVEFNAVVSEFLEEL
jgi:pimeloyl-ACP methyl ester carboxylesterase